MHRVPPQQGGPLQQVIGTAAPHDDGPQAQLMAAAGLFDQQPRHQPTDAPKAVQHNVLGPLQGGHMAADDLRAFAPHEGQGIDAVALGLLHEAGGELAHVDVAGAEVQLRQRLQDGMALKLRKLVLRNLPDIAVRLHDLDDALVVQRPPVAVGHHVLAVQAADDGDHGLGKGLPFLPVRKVVLKVRQRHWISAPKDDGGRPLREGGRLYGRHPRRNNGATKGFRYVRGHGATSASAFNQLTL